MTTKLGISTYALAWSIGVPGHLPPQPMNYGEFIHYCARLGVNLVQIADNLPLDALTESQLDELASEANRLSIAIEVGTRGISPDHLRTYIHIAQKFRSPILRTVVDTATHHPAPAEIVATLIPMLPEFEAANIILAIENHDRFPVQTLAQIIKDINSPYVGICLDTVNSFGSLEGPETVVNVLGPYVVNLHVKDFTIRRVSHNMGFVIEGTPAGKGLLDAPKLIGHLQGIGRNFNAIVEHWPAPEATITETVAKEQQWAQESIRYLKTVIKDS